MQRVGTRRERDNQEFDNWAAQVEYQSEEALYNERYEQFEENQSLIIYQTIQRRRKVPDLSQPSQQQPLLSEFLGEGKKRKKLLSLAP
jgi:hypothetical protein